MEALKPRTPLPGSEARERILRAAERLFAEKGYAATAVHEITEAAQVNKALLYYYFADKSAVYASLIDSGIEEFRLTIEDALASPGPFADRLREFVRAYVDLLSRHANLLRVVQRMLMAGEDQAQELTARFQAAVAPLVRFLADGMAAGDFRPADPGMVVLSLIGMVDKLLVAPGTQGPRFPPERVIAHVTDLLLRGLASSK